MRPFSNENGNQELLRLDPVAAVCFNEAVLE